MRILIIEDNQLHINAAKAQLSEHELTICSSYQEVEALLGVEGRHVKTKLEFDAVLTDLFLPPSWKGTQFQRGVGETILESCVKVAIPIVKNKLDCDDSLTEKIVRNSGLFQVPYGIIFALLCVKWSVPVAIVSDSDHHAGPFSWAMDLVGGFFALGSAKFFTSESLSYYWDEDDNRTKNWAKALAELKLTD